MRDSRSYKILLFWNGERFGLIRYKNTCKKIKKTTPYIIIYQRDLLLHNIVLWLNPVQKELKNASLYQMGPAEAVISS